MAKPTPSAILEFILTQPTPPSLFSSLLLSLPPFTSPPSARISKLLLLRHLALSLLSPPSLKTLTTLELIDQLDRDHRQLSPSPSLQLAYSTVALHVTVQNPNFLDAVEKIWRWRIGDLERSEEGRGLVSEGLREGRRLVEKAVGDVRVREELRRRETGKEVETAIRAYLKEALEGMGPSELERDAAEVLRRRVGRVGRDEASMPVQEKETSSQGGCSTGGFDHFPLPKAYQEKDQLEPRDEKDNNVVEEPLIDVLTETETARDYLNLGRLEERQNLIDRGQESLVVKAASITCTRDISSSHGHSRVNDTTPQHILVNQNPRVEHWNEDQNVLSSINKGKAIINAVSTNTSAGKKKEAHGPRAFNIMDRNPTAHTHEWHDDATEYPPEKSPDPHEKIQIARQKKRAVPPWNEQFARRRKKRWWSADEEDTLRKAVKEYGAGNWTSIKNCYPKVFEDRTPADLKDKWRNMVR